MFVWSLFSAKFLSFLFISLPVYTDQRPCVIIYIPHASPLCCARSSQSELSNEHACHKLLVRGSGVIQAANMSPAYKVTSKVSVARATSALRPSAFAIQRTKKQTQCHSKAQGDQNPTVSVSVACKTLPTAMLAAALLMGTGAMSSEAAANNTSLVDQIHFYQAEKSANSKSQRPATPAQLLEAAATQLGKVETLIGIGQYDSARLQLRQGAASTIRLDLRAYDRSQHNGPGSPQAGKAIVQEVETLDTALKLSKPADECRQLVRQIRHDMSELLAMP